MVESLSDPKPTTCPRCGRQLDTLFCYGCVVDRLSESDLLANREAIESLLRAPTYCSAVAFCLFCGGRIAPRMEAIILDRNTYACLHCVRRLGERLAEVLPRRTPAECDDFDFGAGGVEVK